MKKIKFLSVLVFIAAAIVSCNMVEWDKIVSLGETPTLINKTPKIYPGGNAECSTINIPGLVQTTGRNNYVPSTDGFEKAWPLGLLVKVVDGKYVSFQIDGSINLGDGKCYKIGAVIVKGGDASNVYNYTDNGGVAMDKGLFAPNNASGNPAGLSNLTFCFVECKEKPPVVIAIKSLYSVDGISGYYTLSTGTKIFNAGNWCDGLGINYYPGTSTIPLHWNVGTVTVNDSWSEGSHYLNITVDLNDGLVLDNTYLYVGSLAGLSENLYYGCPQYWYWPYQKDSKENTHIFKIPY